MWASIEHSPLVNEWNHCMEKQWQSCSEGGIRRWRYPKRERERECGHESKPRGGTRDMRRPWLPQRHRSPRPSLVRHVGFVLHCAGVPAAALLFHQCSLAIPISCMPCTCLLSSPLPCTPLPICLPLPLLSLIPSSNKFLHQLCKQASFYSLVWFDLLSFFRSIYWRGTLNFWEQVVN